MTYRCSAGKGKERKGKDCLTARAPSFHLFVLFFSTFSPPFCPTFGSSYADYDPVRVVEVVRRSTSATPSPAFLITPINNSQSSLWIVDKQSGLSSKGGFAQKTCLLHLLCSASSSTRSSSCTATQSPPNFVLDGTTSSPLLTSKQSCGHQASQSCLHQRSSTCLLRLQIQSLPRMSREICPILSARLHQC